MKLRTLSVLCASALCSTAFAANVELFGAVDTFVAVNHTSGIDGKWKAALMSGGTTASHWGLKGTEDLGNGVEVFFNLDNAFLVDNGNATFGNEGKAFSREANIGIRGKYGQLSFGRQYTPHFLVFAISDPTKLSLGSSDSPYFFPGSASVTGQDGNLVRMDNSIQYVLPTPFGLTNFFYLSLGETENSNTRNNTYNYMAKFDYGKFTGMVSYLFRSMTNPGNNDRYHNSYINSALIYDFGFTKPVINFTKKFGSPENGSDNFWMAQIGTSTPLWGGDWQISGSYLRNQSKDKANAWSLGTKYNYPLSKRTSVYVGIEALFNGDNAGYAIEAGPDSSLHFNFNKDDIGTGYGTNYKGSNVQQFFVGINHQF